MKTEIAHRTGLLDRRDFLRQLALAGTGLSGLLPVGAGAVRGRQLHIRNYTDVVSLDPPNVISGAEGVITDAIFQSLLNYKYDGTWDTQLDAAEYFEQVDATQYRFRLKPGQMFSDGFGEMTADDVKFSFERIIDPGLNALNAPDVGPLSHVDVQDRYSGTLVLKSPYAAFIPLGVAGGTGAIMSRRALQSAGGQFTTRPPACSGPYRVREWQAKRKTVLEKNPAWTGSKPGFDEIHVYAMTSDKAAEMAFEAGQLDCARISVESAEPFRMDMPPDSRLQIYPSTRNYWLGMNQSNPALQDVRVRRAIQWAVDVTAVVEAAWFGLAEPSSGPVPGGMLGHRDTTLIPAEGDSDRARALLWEAGVKLPLRLRLDTNNDPLEITAAQVIQWSLKKVGIEVDVRGHDNASFLTMGREDQGEQWRDLQLYFQSFSGGADPYYQLTWFIREQIGQWNWERFDDPEFNRLHHAAIVTVDTIARERMYQRMQDLMELSGCYRFVSNGVMPQIIRNNIEAVYQPDGVPILRGFRPLGHNS